MVGAGVQWREYVQYLKQRMVRQKENDPDDLKTELRRCLSTRDLTCLGVGNTIGVGIYILLGVIAKEHAGPSTILCFMVAISVTMMNALVYAEFSSSVAQTGASYTFLYKVGGEYLAFLCGWLMIISSLCSGSVGARAWSGLLDSFFNHSIQNFSDSVFGEIQFGRPFATHLDWVAFLFQVVITLIVSCNVRCSSVLNTTLSIITVSVLVFVAVAGLVFGDSSNLLNKDHGGFFPFGISGIIKGSSLAVYACSGFEVVSVSAEEAKNPQKSVPRATILELVIVALVYVGAAVGVLFLIPYWLVNTTAPLPSAFSYNGIVWGKFIVTIGPLFSFTNLQMLNLYGTSRILYRMANDGLFFELFLRVHKKSGVPVNSIVSIGIFTSIFSLMCDLSFLIDITILLMLITYIFLGSALIKLKVTKPKTYTKLDNVLESSNNIPESSSHELISTFDNGRLVKNGSLNNLADFDSIQEVEDAAHSQNSIERAGYFVNNSEVPSEADGFHEIMQEDISDSDEDEANILFKKDFHSDHNSKRLLSHRNADNGVRTVENLKSLRVRLAKKFFLFVPGVLSLNAVIFMHWLCCVGLAIQINYGWRDLLNVSIIALAAVSLLLSVLVLLTFLLWINRIDDSSSNFQTPMMPLIPTLSIIFSCILFFSSAKTTGFIEMGVLIVAGSFLYFILIFMDMKTIAGASQDAGQSLSLIGEDNGSDNDEL